MSPALKLAEATLMTADVTTPFEELALLVRERLLAALADAIPIAG